MAGSSKDAVGSDNEGNERPVREQLKKTSIDASAKEFSTRNDLTSVQSLADTDDIPPSVSATATEQNGAAPATETEERGRVSGKRSFEDLESGYTALDREPAITGRHGRKRSRDSTAEDKAPSHSRPLGEEARAGDAQGGEALAVNGTNGVVEPRHVTPALATSEAGDDQQVKEIVSPKSKRSRLDDTNRTEDTEAKSAPKASPSTFPPPRSADEAAVATTADSAAPAPAPEAGEQAKESKGFSDTSATSPFGALASSKSPTSQQQTSSSAFAASGFGSLAASSSSGFGSLSKSNGLSSFAAPATAKPESLKKDDIKPASGSAFGGLGSASSFATAGGSAFGGSSGFGKLGSSAFGGGFGLTGASKLSSFASGSGGGVLGSSAKPPKPFGVSADDDDEASGSDDEDGAVKSPRQDEDSKDERFFAQDVETGEENETTEYTCRAKLYNFVTSTSGDGKKEWKERGLGTIRLNVQNVSDDDDGTSKPKARLVMRADGSHRVILNSPIKKEIKFGSVSGGEPQGGLIYFMGSIDSQPKLELLQLKVRGQFAVELYERVTDLQKEM